MSSEKLHIVNAVLERLKTAYKLSSDAALARHMGVVPSTIANWRRRGSIDHDLIFTKCNDLYEAWILTGEGPMRRGTAAEVKESGNAYGPSEFVCIGPEGAREDFPEKTFILIKHVTGKISAGQGAVPDEGVKAEVAFRKDWITRKGGRGNMSMISVKGDSMEPTLYNGDVVLVDHSKNYVEPQGGLYAIAVDDDIMIKRLEALPEAGRLRIISDNPKYGAREVDATQVVINGKVIWFGRELER